MKHRLVVAWIVAIAMVTAIPAAGGALDPAGDVFDALGLVAIACEQERSTRFEPHIEAYCARTDHTFKELKKAWRKAAKKGALKNQVLGSTASWRTTSTGERVLFLLLAVQPAAIAVDFDAGILTVYYTRTYPECHADFEFVWASPAVPGPNVVERYHADFPTEPLHRGGISGVVVGSFLVDAKGAVVDVCVVGEGPPNLGFAEAAVEGQTRTTYEPAAGRPLVAAQFFTTFETMPDGAPVSLAVEQFFQNAFRRAD